MKQSSKVGLTALRITWMYFLYIAMHDHDSLIWALTDYFSITMHHQDMIKSSMKRFELAAIRQKKTKSSLVKGTTVLVKRKDENFFSRFRCRFSWMQLRLPIPDFSIIFTAEGATGSQLTGYCNICVSFLVIVMWFIGLMLLSDGYRNWISEGLLHKLVTNGAF